MTRRAEVQLAWIFVHGGRWETASGWVATLIDLEEGGHLWSLRAPQGWWWSHWRRKTMLHPTLRAAQECARTEVWLAELAEDMREFREGVA